MITARETVYALYGSWRLARMDRDAIRFFDRSPEGFWRSFWAAGLVLPMDAVLRILQFQDRAADFDVPLSMLGYAAFYATSWLLWPAVVSFLVEPMGARERFVDYVVAYNWTSVPAQLLFFVPAVLSAAFLPPAIASVLLLAAVGAVLAYRGFVAAATLGCNFFAAAAFALGEFALNTILLAPLVQVALAPAA